MLRLSQTYQKVLLISLTVASLDGLAAEFGSYLKPFSADSFWNSKPVMPTFSNYVIPDSIYTPTAYAPTFSASCFYTDSNASPATIKVGAGFSSIHDRDAERHVSQVTIQHWPENVLPATGADGHADIIDVDSNVIHSFYKLKLINGEWTSLLYAWAPLDGRGWGGPAHFYQGGRAVGVPACAGMIRVHEVNDGDVMFRHALSMSLTYNGLSANPGYTYPSTAADLNLTLNTGQIPEGALLMLPASFDLSKIKTPLLKKIANTLKTYGAYVVDRNYGTPYVIYSEIGAATQSTGSAYYEHTLIQKALRVVTSVQGWVDGNGNNFTDNRNLNVLSMRGPWARGFNYQVDSEACTNSCGALGNFNSYQQAVVFESSDEEIIQSNYSGRSITRVAWARPKKGDSFKLSASTTGGGKLRLAIRDPQKNDLIVYDSGYLSDGQSASFSWPIDDFEITTIVSSGVGEASSVSGTLVRIP